MEDIRRMDVFQTAEDLVDEGLEMGICEGLSRADDCGKITLHKFCKILACDVNRLPYNITFIEIGLVEVIRPGNVHIIKTSNLRVSKLVIITKVIDVRYGVLGSVVAA
jgi:hypothetical protein